MWGICAVTFDVVETEHPIIGVKRATVSDFNGKSLNMNGDSAISINPKHTRTKQLYEWYQSSHKAIQPLSSKRSLEDESTPGLNVKAKKLICEIQD